MFFSQLLLVVLLLFSRFIDLNWGNGLFFHPDENNMAQALSQLSFQNWNPHFFAYGQFPLYLGFLTLKLIHQLNSFDNSILILRFWSAIFSVTSVGLIYLITHKLFSKRFAKIASILAIFNPGLIQIAHFGTTESLLVFVFLSAIYLALLIIDHPQRWRYYLLSAFVVGIGLASKISALIFLGPILLALLFSGLTYQQKFRIFIRSFVLIFLTIAFFVLFSPYNLLALPDLLSSLSYETSVASGNTLVFYTSQFIGTFPYLFQIKNIFPYASGIFQFIFGIIGLIIFLKNFSNLSYRLRRYWFLVLIPSFVYFAYFGYLYVKWTRFVSPLFFLFPLFSTYFILKFKSNLSRLLLVTIVCLPGVLFLNLYMQPDIRFTASRWLVSNLPQNSKVFSEGGNVINLPLVANTLDVTNFDFYTLDKNLSQNIDLAKKLSQAQYLIIPSRRVFKNQNNSHFPYSQKYYQHLFNGSLGFTLIKEFSPQTDLFLNPENAEETWTVFDRPTIRVYQKTANLSYQQYLDLLNP